MQYLIVKTAKIIKHYCIGILEILKRVYTPFTIEIHKCYISLSMLYYNKKAPDLKVQEIKNNIISF